MEAKENLSEIKSSGSTTSYWIDSMEPIKYSPLKKNIKTDVIIVGGGISGISIAYNLALQGKKTVLIEDGYIGSGETGRTTAHLVTALDDRYYMLEQIHGENGAKLAAESHSKAIDFIEDTIRKEKIDCEFERLNGYLFLHPHDEEASLEKEFKAALKAGVDLEMLDNIPGMNETGKCLSFHGQAQFHILKYLKGLCESIVRYKGEIYTETHAKLVDHTGVVTNDGYRIDADQIVIATNTPINDQFVIHTKQTAYRSYVIAAKIKKDILLKALWWDTGDKKANPDVPPYHYIRLQKFDDDHDLLIAGGEDHITGHENTEEEEWYAKLETWTRNRFPIEEVVYRWSGQVMETMDSLAFIGRNPMDRENVYIVTGDSGNGMTHGTIAGILIPDLINGAPNKWEKLYDPSRFKIFKTTKSYFKDNLGVVGEFLRDHVNADHLSDIGEGEGKIIQIKDEKYGVYRDEDEQLHIVSAVCPHLKCIVNWNKTEKSWDCPCHGSRFTCDGKVMNGPANVDLEYRVLSTII